MVNDIPLMKLNAKTDFLYRSMIYVALHQDRLVTAKEISDAYSLSHNHIAKVIKELVGAGILEGVRGRGGGVRLLKSADDIKLDEIMELAEGRDSIVDCKNGIGGPCCIAPACRLKSILGEAQSAFFAVLGKYSLASLIEEPERRKALEKILKQ